MKTFEEIIANTPAPEQVYPIYKYFAYDKGQVFECGSIVEARAKSTNYQKVFVNEDEVKASKIAQQQFEAQLQINFYDDIKELLIKEYSLVFGTDPAKWDTIFHILKHQAEQNFEGCPDEIVQRIEDLASMTQCIF